jgi:ankyrin repeat protein
MTLLEAAETGDVAQVNILLAEWVDTRQKDAQENTALHLAAQRGHTEIVNLLTNSGQRDLQKKNKDKNTPLHLAAANGHTDTLLALLKKGAPINASNIDKNTALHLAAQNGHLAVILALIAQNADLNADNAEQYTALHFACLNGHSESALALIHAGANVHKKTQYIKTTDNNKKNFWYSTALIFAVRQNLLEVSQELIKKNANINVSSFWGDTPLLIATENGNSAIVSLLLNQQSIVTDMRNTANETLLSIAAKQGHLDMAKLFIEKKVPINDRSHHNQTALDLAALHGHREMVEWLIQQGADLNKDDNRGYTALHYAAQGGKMLTIQTLLRHGFNINEPTNVENMALHIALMYKHFELSLQLIEHGALTNRQNGNNQTPLEICLTKCRQLFQNRNEITAPQYKLMQTVTQILILRSTDANIDYTLTRLGLMPHKNAILHLNLWAGMTDNLMLQFINNAQNTHHSLVTKTVAASMRVLKARYTLLPDAVQAIEEQILNTSYELCLSPDMHKKIWFFIHQKQPEKMTLHEKTLLEILKEPNPEIPLINFIKKFIYRINTSSQEKIRQSIHLLWVAVHDEQNRYITGNTIAKDIQDAEEAMVFQMLLADDCTEGGLFHPIVSLCRFHGIPGIYVHELLTEMAEVTRPTLLNLLDPISAFNWVDRDRIKSDDSLYQRFINIIRHNQMLYKKLGQTQMAFFGQKQEIFSPENLSLFARFLTLSRDQYFLLLAQKAIRQKSVTPEQEQQKQLESWSVTLKSPSPGLAWEAMGGYYTQQIQNVVKGKISLNVLKTQMTENYQYLARLCPEQDKKDDEGSSLLGDFFERKQDDLIKALLPPASPPPLILTPPAEQPSPERKRPLADDAAEMRKKPAI